MTETLTQPRQPEQIDPALAAEWFSVAQQIAPFDQLTVINRGNGPEELVFHDVLDKQIRDESGNIIDRVPTVVLSHEDGSTEDFAVADFLTYVGADSFGLRHIVDEAKKPTVNQAESTDAINEHVRTTYIAGYAGETAVTPAVEYVDKAHVDNEYDRFFAPEANNSNQAVDKLTAPEIKNPRLEALFAPITSLDEFKTANPAEQTSYDYLFMEDGPARDAIVRENRIISDKRRLAEEGHPIINPESKAKATATISEARIRDSKLDATLTEYGQQHPDTALVDAIRTDADLRYVLGDYLLNTKMSQRITKMPERIRANSQKNPNHRGYAHHNYVSSREYATLLALSMLDGTFEGTPRGDEIATRPSDGEVIVGQHRAAAMELLK